MLLSQVPGYFKARRDRLMKANPGAAFLLPAATEFLRNPDVHFPFRQESNFYYLTGFEEPESFLVIADSKTTLFVRRRDPHHEMWDGERYGVDGAVRVFGVDAAYPIDELEQKLPELLKGSEKVYYRMGLAHQERVDQRVLSALDSFRRSQGRSGNALAPVLDPQEQLGEMRLFKAPEEVEFLRKACKITALAHKALMQEVRPGMYEYEVEALIDYTFRKNGCGRVGYGSIVAGGRNATCLHYRSNNEKLKEGDLLLIDAGGEYNYYTSDITRTFPVGKRFSDGQAKIYDLVLKSQKEAIALAKPGSTQVDIHRRASEVLVEGMLSLGLMKGNRDELIKSGEFRRFYPHGTGHYLGMDVHDVGLYTKDGSPRKLEPGMVFTIEPGFYVQPSDTAAPEEFRDIGIRIEDDVLITPSGCEIMTSDAPKERGDVEKLR